MQNQYDKDRGESLIIENRYIIRSNGSTSPNRIKSSASLRSLKAQNKRISQSLPSRKQSLTNSLQDTIFRSRRNEPKVHESTIVLVGDSNCGKTSLVLSYINQTFSEPPKSVIFETYDKLVKLDSENFVDLNFWDFPGNESFDRFRPLGYANATWILVCFTLDDVETLNHIRERWIPEVETHCPQANKLIIGIGSEARFDKSKSNKIPTEDYCQKFARHLNCRYTECSLIDGKSINAIFGRLALESIGCYDGEDKIYVNKKRASTIRTRVNRYKSNTDQVQPTTRKTSFRKQKDYCIVA